LCTIEPIRDHARDRRGIPMRVMQVDELMAEMDWVRRLARGLLRDSAAADDIAQDAWLVASERAPEDDRPLRPWLHRVVLNLVRMRRRSDTRRDERELASGEDRAMPSSEELLARVETQRVLAAEVVALREPYRSTILLHYVEGLSSAEIARQLGIPSATVRQRLKHALDELRDRLRARADSPKQGWLAALVPLAKVRPQPALAIGAVVMKKSIAVIVVIVLLLLAGGVAWRHFAGRAHPSDGVPGGATQGALAATRAQWSPPDAPLIVLPAWLAQAGVANRRVAGRVVFGTEPVPGAVVRLGVLASGVRLAAPAMTPGPPFMEVAKRVANARGEFDFGALPAASLVISAEADGKAPVSLGLALADPKIATDHLVLVLGGCRTSVSGTVRDTASPIARARLKIAGLAGTQSDDHGRFALCMPFARYPNIRVEADGYGTINVQVPPMSGAIHRDFVMVPEATIEGDVVDEAGVEVPGAIVSARPALSDAQDEATAVDALADPHGHYRIAGLAPTKYSLGAYAEHGQSSDHPVVVAAAGTATRNIKLVIGRRARLRGRVVMRGAPVEGAHVGILHDGRAIGATSVAISQADGTFVLDGAPLGTASMVAAPYDVVSPKSVAVTGDVDNLVIEVAAMASVRGRVTRHGQPVADAQIELLPTRSTTIADEGGNYVLDGVPAGSFVLYASSSQAFTNHPITLAAGEAQDLDLELESGGEVKGTVVDRAGTPVAGVLVRLTGDDDSGSSMTDARGNFDCATLAGHRDYHVGVYPNAGERVPYKPVAGSEFPPIPVADGDTVIRDVQLAIVHDELAIRGKVVDDTGLTMSDARVTIADSLNWGDPSRTRADGDGGFIIDGLVPGHYDLRARMADGSVGDAKQVAAGTNGVTITLIRPGRIEGTLAGFTTAPMVVAAIGTYTEPDVHDAMVTGTHFTITGLKPASYTVQALVDGVQLDGAVAEVRAGATSQVTLHARPRTTVEGHVVELASHAPVAGMACRATLAIDQREGTSVGQAPAQQLTDATGHFSLDAQVGTTRITCETGSSAYSSAGGNVEVTASGAHVEVYAVRVVAPPSNPRFGLDPLLIPPAVLRALQSAPVDAGDIITSVDGLDVSNFLADAVLTLVSNHRPGTSAILGVLRGGAPVTVRVPVH
jgi:RNA polymerase sigma-70 factor (ECF subfamily)